MGLGIEKFAFTLTLLITLTDISLFISWDKRITNKCSKSLKLAILKMYRVIGEKVVS